MKKKFFATVAVALLLLAGCSDDTGFEALTGKVQESGMSATIDGPIDLVTRMAVRQEGANVPQGGSKMLTWQSKELVRVFTLNRLQQDLYQEVSGAGTSSAIFKQIVNNNLPATDQLYAVTEAASIYGISAYQEGIESPMPLLTLTLPGSYTAETDDAGFKKFPVPFWGAATVSGSSEFATPEDPDAKVLNATMTGLTAYLRVSAQYLPKGTKAIVLTTHGHKNLMQNSDGENKEGYQLVSPERLNSIGGYNDMNQWWEANVDYTVGGNSEALSGTLNCILDKDNIDETYLKIDDDGRLVYSDTLRVNLPGTVGNDMVANTVFYIPIVVGQYDNLHVMAVTGDSKYTYRWIGYELKTFENTFFKRNKVYYADVNLIELGDACIGKLNKAIDNYNQQAGRTTIIEVDSLYINAPEPNHSNDYSDTEIQYSGFGNLILNIRAIGDNSNSIGQSRTAPLKVVNKNHSYMNTSEDATKTVNINVPIYWDANGDESYDQENYLEVRLGDANVILGTVEKLNSITVTTGVLASNTKYVSGHSLNRSNLDVYDDKNAALLVENGFREIDVFAPQAGDVYVCTDQQSYEETEISCLFNIQTLKAINIRLDDALVKRLQFSKDAENDRYVFSTGSTAIASVLNGDGKEYRDINLTDKGTQNLVDNIASQITPGQDHGITPGVTLVSNNTVSIAPNQVIMESYWTGKALSPYAISQGYDVSTIYTVAQLASVGEGLKDPSNLNVTSDHMTNPYTRERQVVNEINPYTAHYVIPKDLINFFWLGDDKWKWLGAEATVEPFTLHGENVRLVNMQLLTEWDGPTYMIDDPHYCCTTCGNPETTSTKVYVNEDLGLIRSIWNEDSVEVQWINLNDVLYNNTEADIWYVGAIAGYVNAPKVGLFYNYVGEVKFDTNSSYLGGMFGIVNGAGEYINMHHNEVAGHSNSSGYIKSKQPHVGGIAGRVFSANAPVTFNDNRADVSSIHGLWHVGGLIGCFATEEGKEVFAKGNFVYVSKNIDADENYTGGMIGSMQSDGATTLADNKVIVRQSIESGISYTGGLVGELLVKDDLGISNNQVKVEKNLSSATNYTGGLAGLLNAEKSVTTSDNQVTIGKVLNAGNDFAGGLFGDLMVENDIELNNDNVKAEEITAGNSFAGGFAGRVTVNDGQSTTIDAQVTVPGIIGAGNEYVGGLNGQVRMVKFQMGNYVRSADVTVGTIKAIYGYAGGIHGQAVTGQFHIGFSRPLCCCYVRDYLVDIDVNLMAGALAVGGVVGNNASTSMMSPLYIHAGRSNDWTGDYTTKVHVNIKDWANTQTADYFNAADVPAHYAGTFGNILGMMQGNLYIDEYWDRGVKVFLNVEENLTSAKKEELLFKIHTDQLHNIGADQYYWGDGNGYLGWNITQQYYIDGVLQRGEQLDMGPGRWGHNIYLKETEDIATDISYATAKTKIEDATQAEEAETPESDYEIAGIPVETERNPTITTPTTQIPSGVTFSPWTINGVPAFRAAIPGISYPDGSGWVDLIGTGLPGQNVWVEIDNCPRGVLTEKVSTQLVMPVDIVFTVDNSGSMSEEANAIARDISNWAISLINSGLDARFGIVGYGRHVGYEYPTLHPNYGVSGALNLTTYSELDAFLNRSGHNGVDRTVGFAGSDASSLATIAAQNEYSMAGGECGVQAIRFADSNFNFRIGATRIYVNFTDDLNFTGGNSNISISYIENPDTWPAEKGTIYSVISNSESILRGRSTSLGFGELPWLISDYTGGTISFVKSDFSDVSLPNLPITAALQNSYFLYITDVRYLMDGLEHKVKITVYTPGGAVAAERVYYVVFGSYPLSAPGKRK